MRSVTDRFLTYIKHYTTSAEDSSSFPSTERQLRFAEFLAKECKAIGLSEVAVDGYGYMTATLQMCIRDSAYTSNLSTSLSLRGLTSEEWEILS